MEDRPAADHGRPGRGRARRHARPAAVHADRRDDASRAADHAAARPLRHPAPPRQLPRRRGSPRSSPLSAAILGVDVEPAGARGDRRPLTRDAARRQPAAQARARLRRGPRGRRRRPPTAAGQALELLEVDHLGLDRLDREILDAVCAKFGGGPVGLSTLAVTVGEEADTIEDVYEPYLLQQGMLKRTPRGRMATALAFEHLGLEPPSGPRSAVRATRASRARPLALRQHQHVVDIDVVAGRRRIDRDLAAVDGQPRPRQPDVHADVARAEAQRRRGRAAEQDLAAAVVDAEKLGAAGRRRTVTAPAGGARGRARRCVARRSRVFVVVVPVGLRGRRPPWARRRARRGRRRRGRRRASVVVEGRRRRPVVPAGSALCALWSLPTSYLARRPRPRSPDDDRRADASPHRRDNSARRRAGDAPSTTRSPGAAAHQVGSPWPRRPAPARPRPGSAPPPSARPRRTRRRSARPSAAVARRRRSLRARARCDRRSRDQPEGRARRPSAPRIYVTRVRSRRPRI